MRARTIAAFVVLAAIAVSAQDLSTNIKPGITVPFDRTLRPETNYLIFDNINNYGPIDIRVADNYTGNQPNQIHLSLAGPKSYWVMWATGQGRVRVTSCTDTSQFVLHLTC
ncbi:g4596 [Coccomyxa elongata]